ncbi:hypothetical protein F4860DRAFT_468389 [Xylaria cubensis]|nr:hypothetical protein F4860DRAFT_468389 [Xylaria cubensis]
MCYTRSPGLLSCIICGHVLLQSVVLQYNAVVSSNVAVVRGKGRPRTIPFLYTIAPTVSSTGPIGLLSILRESLVYKATEGRLYYLSVPDIGSMLTAP